MVSLSNGSHSDERLGRITVPNGHRSPLRGLLKGKRRRVSAVRTYPPGCGRFALQITPDPKVPPESFAQHLVDKDKEDNSKLNGNNFGLPSDSKTELEISISSELPGTSNTLVGVVRNLNCLSEEFTPVEAKSLTQPTENFDVQTEKMNLPLTELETVVIGTVTEPINTENFGTSSPRRHESDEAFYAQKEKMNLPEPLEAESVEKPLTELETAGSGMVTEPINTETFGTSSPRRHESDEALNVPSVPLQLDVAEPKASVKEIHLQHDELLVKRSIGSDKTTAKTFPSRRRVSAVRDFPPFCGRNAPCPSRDEINELVTCAEKKGLEIITFGTEKLSNKEFTTMTNVNHLGQEIIDKDSQKSLEKYNIVKPNEIELKKKQSELVTSFSTGENTEERVAKVGEVSVTCEKENPMNETLVERETLGKKVSDQTHHEYLNATEFSSEGEHPPLREERKVKELNRSSGSGARKVKKNDFILLPRAKPVKKIKNSIEGEDEDVEKASTNKELTIKDNNKPLEHNMKAKNLSGSRRSHSYDVNVPPLRSRSSNGQSDDADSTGMRSKVRETLRIFHSVCRKLLQGEEAKDAQSSKSIRRIDFEANKILRHSHKLVNVGKQIIGVVPGTEIGDEFQYRIELNIVGLHRQTQGGIDYLNERGKLLATSIVASGGYDNELTEKSDFLIYTGQGGNVMNQDKEPENQKLERGNLALANSKEAQNPVRVIRSEKKASYIYDGLYLVEEWWQEQGPHGKLVFKFKLCRIPGQPELAWKIVKKVKKAQEREGLCALDISNGKEKFPISAVNTIDDEKPPIFTYTAKMIYPSSFELVPSKGCDCTGICSDSRKCLCIQKNGGEIPYNHDGAIVEVKALVYECGPSCKCPPSCYNRSSQHGIRFQLEIFKTESRGWGVRSLNSIPSGSFICEYIGELLEEKEAARRIGNDEYLFEIGSNYNDNSLQDEVSAMMHNNKPSSSQIVEDGEFTIDAAQYGNIGRFVNHSCSPNLYAQNVLYDHGDKRAPRIMLFAAENIPPLQELTYDYHYMIDSVEDSNGQIRKKKCFCGSTECIGWLY